MTLASRSLPARTMFLVLVVLVGAACGSNPSSSAAPSEPIRPSAPAQPSTATPPPSVAAPSPGSLDAPSGTPFADVPFAFSADAVIGFYEGEGLSCAAPAPSTKAAGWTVRTCQGTDSAGRPLAIGVVTDPAGRLGNGFASVTALPGEDLLEPMDAVDMLSGFLGAMLGDVAATGQLPWLAGHLGDAYAETSLGGGRIATYTESSDDPTRIYVEVAGPGYLAAPAP